MGAAGAILAIPLTSAIAICPAAFPSTRPLSVLIANDDSVDGSQASLVKKAPVIQLPDKPSADSHCRSMVNRPTSTPKHFMLR